MLLRPKLTLIVWFRLCIFLKDSRLKLLFYPSKLIMHFYRQITGIQIDDGTQIGGIYFEHYSCIAVTKGAEIGKNITLFQGTTIGKNYGGKNMAIQK